jgi:hypothetical protein
MTPYQIFQLQKEIEEQQDQARRDRFISGETDAECGCRPESINPDYLAGYINRLHSLGTRPDGKINYPDRWARYGSPDPGITCDEF